ncbi:hypothetical protein TU94_28285 [Streptomyces cyaneogriseus subsp. noncyanogenus]|uniref:Uncharacterized protein n=1 Tax=Streptomyces cyaneogriseus subsp. noncyanogenus TaxID=477245 RepID=A0A0C5G8U0_9ACTN|nr:hypothetical protein [Streptomyces cyaneogriseus]AJP04764.1 hypothetical protein TU94_28285 [Streptomyces cyaneogriseus subsp. noncyanogenus]
MLGPALAVALCRRAVRAAARMWDAKAIRSSASSSAISGVSRASSGFSSSISTWAARTLGSGAVGSEAIRTDQEKCARPGFSMVGTVTPSMSP